MSYKTKICTTLHKIYDILCLTIRVADLDPDLKDPNHFAGAGSGSATLPKAKLNFEISLLNMNILKNKLNYRTLNSEH